MTKQEIFTKVATHLLTQRRRAAANGSCMYRTPRGLTCAVGCLIPTEKYTVQIEGYFLAQLYDILPTGCRRNHRLLYALQRIHDYSESRDWEAKLSSLAREAKLKMPKL